MKDVFENYLHKHDLSYEDAIYRLNNLEENDIHKSNFYVEMRDNDAYIEVKDGYKLVFEEIDLKAGYIRIKAVKEDK